MMRDEEEAATESPSTTPQMLTLGRSDTDRDHDGDDYYVDLAERQTQTQPSSSDCRSRGWLSRLWMSSKDADQDRCRPAESSSSPTRRVTKTPTASTTDAAPRQRLHPLQLTDDDAVYTALENLGVGGGNSGGEGEFREDGLLQPSSSQQQQHDGEDSDSFFFRPSDHHPTSSPMRMMNHRVSSRRYSSPTRRHRPSYTSNGSTFRTLRRTHRHGELFVYSDAVDVTLPPPLLSQFRLRYEQLNQELPVIMRRNSDDEYDEEANNSNNELHDLSLREDGLHEQNGIDSNGYYRNVDDPAHIVTPGGRRSRGGNGSSGNNNNIIDTASVSSLYVETIDGRKFMQLPRDHIRLLMDPDLDAGILCSVVEEETDYEYDEETTTTTTSIVATTTTNNTADPAALQPPPQQPLLSYVLTVDDDLYKRILQEMAPGQIFDKNEKMDIRIAIVIICLVLLLLLVNTLAFHED